MPSELWTKYELEVQSARNLLCDAPAARAQLDPNIEPAVLLRFLIQFSAWGVQMTEPVESWIHRAGQACTQSGLPEVGNELLRHAKHEAGHHQMLIEDTHVLCQRWNEHQRLTLDPKALLRQRPTPAMQRYIALHEQTIAGDTPYAQVAIELEIEGMSTTLGKAFVKNCRAVLGDEGLAGLSFIKEHVALDVGHTVLNTRMLERVLELRPEAVSTLAAVGSEALRTYLEFFAECLGVATYDVSRLDDRPD